MSSLPEPRRFTVGEYLRMAELGILRADERVELIDGAIVAMSPQGAGHSGLISKIGRDLYKWYPEARYCVRQQSTLPLGQDFAPEPDLAVAEGRCEQHLADYPRQVVLIIEIADSSLRMDSGRKAHLYAAAGVPEYWVVSLPAREILVHREPSPAGYQQLRRLQREDPLLPLALEGTGASPLRAADCLPPGPG